MKVAHLILLCLGVVFLSLGCSNSPSSIDTTSQRVPESLPAVGATTSSSGASAYPVPQNESVDNNAAYPIPQPIASYTAYPGQSENGSSLQPQVELLPFELPDLPELSADKGMVVGRVIDGATGQPGFRAPVYLGEKIPVEPGPGYFISTQQNSSPQDMADEQGYFIISEVKPGVYALVIQTPVGAKVLVNPETNDAYWVEVIAGQVTEVGEVLFQFP